MTAGDRRTVGDAFTEADKLIADFFTAADEFVASINATLDRERADHDKLMRGLVHVHGIDPTCAETRDENGELRGDCLRDAPTGYEASA